MSGHIAPKGMYYAIFFALMILTIVTYLVTFVNLGEFNLAVAMAIAVTKASLVILFFMHVYWSPKIIKVSVGMSFFFLLIMLMMVMSDYLSRGYVPGQPPMPPFPNAVTTGTASAGNDHPAKVLPPDYKPGDPEPGEEEHK
jgi:cytochrome c oxidase subunit IV